VSFVVVYILKLTGIGGYYHLIAFLNFIESTNLKEHLINKDWDKFAYGYNGKGYKKINMMKN